MVVVVEEEEEEGADLEEVLLEVLAAVVEVRAHARIPTFDDSMPYKSHYLNSSLNHNFLFLSLDPS